MSKVSLSQTDHWAVLPTLAYELTVVVFLYKLTEKDIRCHSSDNSELCS